MPNISSINGVYPTSYHYDHCSDHVKFSAQERPPTPLTHENLVRHSTMYHNTPVELAKKELMGRYRISMQMEYIRAQKRKNRVEQSSSPTSSSIMSPSPVSSIGSTDTSWSSTNKQQQRRKGRHFNNHRNNTISRRQTDNVVIDAPPLPFPYHNDGVFIPITEQQARSPSPRRMRQDSFSIRSSSVSPVPSLVPYTSGRRSLSPPVWWRAGMGRRKKDVNGQKKQEQHETIIITNESQLPVTCQTQHYTDRDISASLSNTKVQIPTSIIRDTKNNLHRLALLEDKNLTTIPKSPSLNEKTKKTSVSRVKNWVSENMAKSYWKIKSIYYNKNKLFFYKN